VRTLSVQQALTNTSAFHTTNTASPRIVTSIHTPATNTALPLFHNAYFTNQWPLYY
jgi:hypothetical protein